MRKPFICGNWKMNPSGRAGASALATAAGRAAAEGRGVEVGVCPPACYLAEAAAAAKGTPLIIGGQNMHTEASGAFTGEVAGPMLKDLGCRYVILGHSERRHVFGETEAVVRRHVTSGLRGVAKEQAAEAVIAYEPVWAIGTGLTATPAQAEEVHAFIRRLLADLYGAETAEAVRIQYGGSVKGENARDLVREPDIDGALVGGASLKAEEFAKIVMESAKAKGLA